MNFRFTEEQESLRQHARQFLSEELGSDRVLVDQWWIWSQPFSRKLSDRGWVGMTWPKEYGGQGSTYMDRLVVTEELLRYAAPMGYHILGDRQCGPSLIRFGSDEQKSKFLPKIISSEISFALLFSETEAGSDLANIHTQAQETDDGFLINGHKIWSSHGHRADYGWLLAVTDPKAEKKHLGMSEFILDLKRSGVTIRPLEDATGECTFAQLFFDNVRVSKSDLVGEKNRGWFQIMAQVDHERSGIERIMGNYPLLEGLVRYVRETKVHGHPMSGSAVVRDKIADLQVEFEVGRLLLYRVAWMLSEGKVPNCESAMAKLFGTSFSQRLAHVAVEIMGLAGVLRPGSKHAPMQGQAAQSFLNSPCYTIGGGTNEVLRGLIAQRGLGMPAR